MLTVSVMFWTSARKRCSLAMSSAWVDFRSEMSVNAESTPAGAPEGPCSSAVRRPRSRVRPWRSATVMSRNGNGRSADGMRSAVHDGSVDANGAGRPRTSSSGHPNISSACGFQSWTSPSRSVTQMASGAFATMESSSALVARSASSTARVTV